VFFAITLAGKALFLASWYNLPICPGCLTSRVTYGGRCPKTADTYGELSLRMFGLTLNNGEISVLF
jgi:hypothetical protein